MKILVENQTSTTAALCVGKCSTATCGADCPQLQCGIKIK